MESKHKYIISLFVVIVIFIACGKSSNNKSDDNKEKYEKKELKKESTNETEQSTEVKKQESNWSYDEKVDKMTDDKFSYATCISTNEINFDFPYSGGSSFKLILRKKNNKNEVMLSVSKGQFMISLFDNEHVKVKFDDGKAQNYSYGSPSDGSTELIFINNTGNFISNLKKSKKVLIQAEFFSHGSEIIEFDVEGLKWN